MATLVSPGVSVTVIDQSFFIPASAPTVPLLFIATNSSKLQPDGVNQAAGTYEHSVVRTVTSLGQSVQLYGIPNFRSDFTGAQMHGDSRNEYGLFALNQYLGIGNLAYVVRANIDLTDAPITFLTSSILTNTAPVFNGLGNGTLAVTAPSAPGSTLNVEPETIVVKFSDAANYSVTGTLSGIIGYGTANLQFTSNQVKLLVTPGSTPFSTGDSFTFSTVYSSQFTGVGNGTLGALSFDPSSAGKTLIVTFTSPTAFDVNDGVGVIGSGQVNVPFTSQDADFTIEDGTTPFAVGDAFTFTITQASVNNRLGGSDAAKRLSITTALQAEINSNTDVRSEIYEYNLILCPGYPEVVDELVALSVDIDEEAFVIGDTPSTMTPEQVATWSLTTNRQQSMDVAYYYPWGLASNLDGNNVFVAPSGIALRTYAYSDNQSFLWFAPAGVQRGLVTGVTSVGYVSGTLGTATVFEEVNLNRGQRDVLYDYYKNINPIVFFPGNGLLVWGQKTSYSAASALDRVNVVRLVMYIKRQLRKGSFPFVFQPNDTVTRNDIKAMADGLLNDIMVKRGLYDFATLCNTSNNTPDRIDRNELYLDVAIKPVKAAEFIYVPITVLSTGAQMPS